MKRKKNSKKGDHGRVLIIGGSSDYVGAVALAGIAALRVGVDWVTIYAPEKVGYAINALSADLVVKKFKGNNFSSKEIPKAIEESKNYNAVLIGNGIGLNAFSKGFVKKCTRPLVIDADSIKSVSLQDVNDVVFTPHLKELELLLRNSKVKESVIKKLISKKTLLKDKSQLIQKTLKGTNNIILLKGPVDAIISKSTISYNRTGNPGMTKAGTGDVLAGCVVGFIGLGLNPFDAAKKAAYYTGIAGDILKKKKKGYTYLASELANHLCGNL